MLVLDREDSINEGGEEISVIKTKEVKDSKLSIKTAERSSMDLHRCPLFNKSPKII